MAEQEDRAKAYERAWILDMVGPGRWVIVVPKNLRDRVLEHYAFTPEDVPGLVEPLPPGELGQLQRMTIRTFQRPPIHPRTPLPPYPPRAKGRWAR